MHEAALNKGDLHGCLVDIVLAKLGEVQVVRVNFLFTLDKTTAVHLGYSSTLTHCIVLARCSNKVVCLTHLVTEFFSKKGSSKRYLPKLNKFDLIVIKL